MHALTAVSYTRYSSDKQQETSITVQLADIRSFCEKHNIRLIHEYIDEAQTATNSNRKNFQKMIADAPKKEFKLVIVHRMDRWARNVDDARYYKKYLASLGIKMISAIEVFDETPEGEFFELMSMGMAELYSKKLSREARAGKIANAKLANIHGGRPLLGYTTKNKKYVIDENEAQAVKLIFDLTVQGYGYGYIRNYLNRNGYRHSDGRKFTASFYDILRNRKYTGEYIYNKTMRNHNGGRNNHAQRPENEIIRVKGGMPQIIDEETFKKVQQILDERKMKKKYKRKKYGKYLLSGLIKCGYCHHRYEANKQQSPYGMYITYRCDKKVDCPDSKGINAQYLEDYLHNLFAWCLFNPQNTVKLLELIRLCYIQELDRLHNEKTAIELKIYELDKLMQAHIKTMADDEYRMLSKFITETLVSLTQEKSELEYQLEMANEKICDFPDYDYKMIQRNIKACKDIVLKQEFNATQELYQKFVGDIVITNEKVVVQLNLHYLLNSFSPIRCAIEEARINIAHFSHHKFQSLTFEKLNVILSDVGSVCLKRAV